MNTTGTKFYFFGIPLYEHEYIYEKQDRVAKGFIYLPIDSY